MWGIPIAINPLREILYSRNVKPFSFPPAQDSPPSGQAALKSGEHLASQWCRLLSQHHETQSSAETREATHPGDTGFRGILIRVSTAFLPLPGLLSLARQSLTGEDDVVAVDYLGETIAEISHATHPQVDLVIATAAQDLDKEAHRIVTLEQDQVMSGPPSDPNWLFRPNDTWLLPDRTIKQLAAVRVDWDKVKPSYTRRPLWFVQEDNCPLGALLRIAEFNNHLLQEPISSPSFTPRDIDVIAVTTDRFSSVRELLASIRRFLPSELRVTVVAQTPATPAWRRLARRFDARLIHVEEDRGLSFSRNLAVASTDRPIVFLMDDDFQIDSRCRLTDALTILNNHDEIAVLGGNLLDVTHWKEPSSAEVSQGFAMKMLQGPPDIVWRRLEDGPRNRHYVNPFDYFEYCDIVDNFALIRRETVFDIVEWNPALKIGAEHQDLYIRLKSKGIGAVARSNTLKVRNVRVQSRRFQRMRARVDQFFPRLFSDLGLRSFHILGERKRITAQDNGHVLADRRHPDGVYVPAQRISP